MDKKAALDIGGMQFTHHNAVRKEAQYKQIISVIQLQMVDARAVTTLKPEFYKVNHAFFGENYFIVMEKNCISPFLDVFHINCRFKSSKNTT